MKYIRTKDRIYEIDETCKRDNQILFFDNKEQTPDYIIDFFEGKDALKQADTIEELCDMFVVDYGKNHTIFTYFCDLQRHNELYWQDYHKVVGWYAAIWTDKGLIYVAKMNEKGELELI